MGNIYATVADIRAVGYPLTASQETSAEVLLAQASAKLRLTAKQQYKKDIDSMIAEDEDFGLAVKSVVVQSVIRALDGGNQSGNGAVSQNSFTLGSYSVQQTYINAGQNLYFLKNELKELGLYRPQTYGAIELWAGTGEDTS